MAHTKQFVNIAISFLCLANISRLYSQEDGTGEGSKQEDWIESVAMQGNDDDFSEIAEHLAEYRKRPLNINSASKDDLLDLGLLTEFQAISLIAYRDSFGYFQSTNELLTINGFTIETVESIVPFITIAPPEVPVKEYKSALRHIRNDVTFRTRRKFETANGFLPASDSTYKGQHYLGNPDYIYARYRVSAGDALKAGFTTSKGVGEKFYTKEKSIEFASGFVQANGIGHIRKIVIGDYYAGFGQGLVIWTPASITKSADVLKTSKSVYGFNGYSSTNEWRYMRGAAASLCFGNLQWNSFVSYKPRDANVTVFDSVHNKVVQVSTILTSGQHALPADFENKNRIHEAIVGTNVSINQQFYRIGATLTGIQYDASINPVDDPYQIKNFRGKEIGTAGVDYKASLGRFILFAEAATQSTKCLALLQGVSASIAPDVNFTALYRNYQAGYFAPYANAFRESSQTGNEKGIYTALEMSPLKSLTINASADVFSFPWLRNNVDEPSNGHEMMVQAKYILGNGVIVNARFSRKSQEQNLSTGNATRTLDLQSTNRTRFNILYPVGFHLEFIDRAEFSDFSSSNAGEQGYLFYHDMIWKNEFSPIQIAARYLVYQTNGYNSRVYAYEPDVTSGFAVPAFYGKGAGGYLSSRYNFGRLLSIWLRYGITFQYDKALTSTDPGFIKGNHTSEGALQVMIRF